MDRVVQCSDVRSFLMETDDSRHLITITSIPSAGCPGDRDQLNVLMSAIADFIHSMNEEGKIFEYSQRGDE